LRYPLAISPNPVAVSLTLATIHFPVVFTSPAFRLVKMALDTRALRSAVVTVRVR
jgi:hypothetical protein